MLKEGDNPIQDKVNHVTNVMTDSVRDFKPIKFVCYTTAYILTSLTTRTLISIAHGLEEGVMDSIARGYNVDGPWHRDEVDI